MWRLYVTNDRSLNVHVQKFQCDDKAARRAEPLKKLLVFDESTRYNMTTTE